MLPADHRTDSGHQVLVYALTLETATRIESTPRLDREILPHRRPGEREATVRCQGLIIKPWELDRVESANLRRAVTLDRPEQALTGGSREEGPQPSREPEMRPILSTQRALQGKQEEDQPVPQEQVVRSALPVPVGGYARSLMQFSRTNDSVHESQNLHNCELHSRALSGGRCHQSGSFSRASLSSLVLRCQINAIDSATISETAAAMTIRAWL